MAHVAFKFREAIFGQIYAASWQPVHPQTSECTEYKYDTEFGRRKMMRWNGVCFGMPDL